MNKHRLWRAAAALLLTAALLIPSAAALTYGDTAGHWAESAIEAWSVRGVINGSGGLFRPGSDITRAELAAILQRVMGYRDAGENPFTDLPEGQWYTQPVLLAAAAGVLQGSGGKVRPTDPVTRQEAVVMIARAFSLSGPDSAPAEYTDAPEIASWAAGAVNAMTERGYLQGSGGFFRPADKLTRAEAVTILDNIVKGFYSAPGTYEGDTAGSALVNAGGVTLEGVTVNGDLYLAPGAVGEPVTLKDVTVTGSLVNLSAQQPVIVTTPPEEPEEPEEPEIPEEPEAPDPREQWPEGCIRGIDVSRHQGDIDWTAVAADGVEFAMIRVGYRGYTLGTANLDLNYRQNIEGALAAGLKVGVYFYSQAISVEEALEEARMTLDAIRGYDISYPVVFDWETVSSPDGRANNLDTQTLCDAANAFCGLVASEGYTPMVYFSKTLATNYYDLTQIEQYDFWYAYYQPSAQIPTGHSFTMWQFTSSGTVSGIQGRVDLDACYKPY